MTDNERMRPDIDWLAKQCEVRGSNAADLLAKLQARVSPEIKLRSIVIEAQNSVESRHIRRQAALDNSILKEGQPELLERAIARHTTVRSLLAEIESTAAELDKRHELEKAEARKAVQEAFAVIAVPPGKVTGRMQDLKPSSEDQRRLVDGWVPSLVAEWKRSGAASSQRFPESVAVDVATAARAAENLVGKWLAARFPAPHTVYDLSIRQVLENPLELPEAVRVALIELDPRHRDFSTKEPIAADFAVLLDSGEVLLFDAKNTMRSAYAVSFKISERKLKAGRVTVVAVWTDRTSIPRNELHVLGEMDGAAVNDRVPRSTDISSHGRSNRDEHSGLVFHFPEHAYPEAGAARQAALRELERSAPLEGSIAAAILGSIPSGVAIKVAESDQQQVVDTFVAALAARRPERRFSPPSLGEVYAAALGMLSNYAVAEYVEKGSRGTATFPLYRLCQLLGRLDRSSPGSPLGVWDPSGAFESLLKSMVLLQSAAVWRGLSDVKRLDVTDRGTILAVSKAKGQLRRMVARCSCGCGELLIRGRTVVAKSSNKAFDNGCPQCGVLLCSHLSGCARQRGDLKKSEAEDIGQSSCLREGQM